MGLEAGIQRHQNFSHLKRQLKIVETGLCTESGLVEADG